MSYYGADDFDEPPAGGCSPPHVPAGQLLAQEAQRDGAQLAPATAGDDDGEVRSCYVANLSYDCTDARLKALFAEVGPVDSVNIATDQTTGTPRGFGFVTFVAHADAARAPLMMTGREVDARAIRCELAKRSKGHGRTPGRYRGPPSAAGAGAAPQQHQHQRAAADAPGAAAAAAAAAALPPGHHHHHRDHYRAPPPSRRDHQRHDERKDDYVITSLKDTEALERKAKQNSRYPAEPAQDAGRRPRYDDYRR